MHTQNTSQFTFQTTICIEIKKKGIKKKKKREISGHITNTINNKPILIKIII